MHKEAEETQMIQETQTKKSPSILVIALGLICIILAASTIAAFTLNTPDTTELDKKDKKIDELNTQVAKLTAEIAVLVANQNQNTDQTATINSLNAKIASLNEEIAAAKSAAESWRRIATLEESEVVFNKTITQYQETSEIIFRESTKYAGYVVIEASANSTETVYFEISYTYKDLDYYQKEYLGREGVKSTILVPVLPSSVKITVGNDNQIIDGADKERMDAKINILITMYW